MLFNLSKCRYFLHKGQTGLSMCPAMNYGPCFSAGESNELSVKEPFNGEGNAESFVN